MSVLRSRVSAVVLTIVALLCLTGSSRAFITKVNGTLAGTVSFHFYLSTNHEQAAKLRIVEFVIQEQKSEKEWVTIWELKGKQSLDAIRYGAKYDGLSETVPAKPLSRNTKYRALLSERAWLRPTGYSTVNFVFDENGAVAVSEP